MAKTIADYPRCTIPLDGSEIFAGWQDGRQVSMPLSALAAAMSSSSLAAIATAQGSALTAITTAGSTALTSITTAAASAAAAESTALANVTAAAASITGLATTINANTPLHGDLATALVRNCAVTTATTNADGTVTISGSQAAFTFSAGPTFLAARTAGTPVTFVFERVSGAALTGAPTVYRKAGFSNLHNDPMILGTDGVYTLSIVLDPTCDSVQITATSSGSTVMRLPGFTPGTPARPHGDPKLLTGEGAARGAIDTVTPIPYTVSNSLSGGGTYANGLLTAPNGTVNWVDFLAPQTIADGAFGVISFESDVPLGNVVNALSTLYSAGHSGAPLTTPVLEQITDTLYQVVFDVQSAGYPFAGFRIGFNNTSGLTAHIRNVQIWPGKVLPSKLAIGALDQKCADDAAYLAISDVWARRRVIVHGDSTSNNYALNAGDNWPQQLQRRSGDAVRIFNDAFAGNVAKVAGALAGAINPAITISGNQLPADLTPVAVTAFDIAPTMGFTKTNPDLDQIWLLEGVKVRVSSATFDGSTQLPTALQVARVTPGAVTPVPAGSPLMCVQGLQTSNDFHIMWGWFNSSSETLTGMIAFVARFGAENCLIMPALQALSSPAVNAYSAAMQLAWPGRVYDPNFAPTTPELAYLLAKYGWSPDSTDNTYIAANKMPPGLRLSGDNIHLNAMGSDIISQRVYASPQYQAFLFARRKPDALLGEVRNYPAAPNQRWLQCNGATVSTLATDFPALYGVLGSTTLPTINLSPTPGPTKAFIYAGANG